jgi:hypothetical protein
MEEQRMYQREILCAALALVPAACVTQSPAPDPQADVATQAVDQAEDLDATYPQPPWVAPSLRVDGNFPGGVLAFATAQDFAGFYRALDAANGSDGAANEARGTTPFSAASTANATVNYQSFTVQLAAGQVLDFGTCGVEGSAVLGDSYLRLLLAGNELMSNDDACGGVGSKLSFTAAASGAYEVRMGCFSAGSCSGTVGYSISTPGPTNGVAGARSYSAASTGSATSGFSTLVLPLSQGQVIDVGTCGVPGASFAGDTYLRLIDAQLGGNVEVATSDDACGLGSRITYRVPRDGIYQVRLGCFSSGTCSATAAYTITPEPGVHDLLPAGFTSAADVLANRPAEPAGDAINDVDAGEFALDLAGALTEDDTLGRLVDRDLEIVVGDQMYQLTSMGVFQVDLSALAAYRAWRADHAAAIDTDPSFLSIPGETALGDGSYQVMPGVIRTVGGWGIPSVKLLGFDEDGGCTACSTKSTPGAAGASTAAPGPTPVGDGPGRFGVIGELGRISYWSGKVNTHKPAGGSWTWDADCVSGANIDPLTYCRKFWPETSSVTPVNLSSKAGSLWFTAGCGQAFPSDGQQEWTCNGPLPSCNQDPPPINYANFSLGSSFSDKESVSFGNKRFVFKARSPGFRLSIGNFEIGFHTIYIKGKLQRRKRFLGISYWGPSTADEIVVGVENMKLDTDYIVPVPQMYNTLAQPKFQNLAKYKLGSKLIDVANISFNANLPFFPITQNNLAAWANSAINSLIGSIYTNIWQGIENNIMDAIDPSFRTRYAAYTKRVDAINDQNKLRWVIGAALKPECNVHKNNWTFDTNFGIKFTQNGGVAGPPGTPPAQVNYKYSMKAGAFYGRTRVGSSWYGIRMVRQ